MAITSRTLDELFSSMATGSLERANLNNLKHINFLQTPTMLPMNRDMYGYHFFVRPQLNMQKDNIRNVRELSSLLSDNMLSIQTYIRCLLDPRLKPGVSYSSGSIPPVNCPIIDNFSAFIPTFTNSVLSSSGFPSLAVPTFKSNPGLYNEVYTMVDGRVINFDSYDVTVNFLNTKGDVNVYILYVWAVYMSMVFEGKLVPYLDFITENTLDYNTRIYRVVTDYTKRYITKLACCNVAIPVGVPTGEMFDQPGDKPLIDANQQISVRFTCNGFRVFDPLIVYDFNRTVQIFNPSMEDENRENSMVKLPAELYELFNTEGRVYPRINGETRELEWWTFAEDFNEITTKYLQGAYTGNDQNYEGD